MVTNLYRRLYTTEEVYQSFVISHVIPNLGEYGKDELRRTPISQEIYQIVRFMGRPKIFDKTNLIFLGNENDEGMVHF